MSRFTFALLLEVAAFSVAVSGCGCNGVPTRRGNGDEDLAVSASGDDGGGGNDDDGGSPVDLSQPFAERDLTVILQLDGPTGHAYSDLGESDSGLCPAMMTGMACGKPIADNAGCVAVELCGANGKGNGLDDDCNGLVDDTCGCTPGDVEPCFTGPPGKHKVGACTDGTQTCFGGEFGAWGQCMGSISPTAEVCDKLDNDCNGCADDGLCCGSLLQCPGTVPNINPYTDVTYDGGKYFTGAVKTWTWTVVGGPCDQLFATTTKPVVQSYTFTGNTTQKPTLHFTLSGDYTVTMTALGTDGNTYSCNWVQHVVGPGVRFELCWDHTGTGAAGGADLDLHVHKPNSTVNWFEDPASPDMPVNDDCFYANCTVDAHVSPFPFIPAGPYADWGYGHTAIANCQGAPASVLGSSWTTLGYCFDPRLDLDNVSDSGKPENTNIDNPNNGDSFRALIHYYGQDGKTSKKTVEEHPIVNIYCGGTLTASFGQAPNTLTGFNFGSGDNAGQMWRVADVAAIVDPSGATTGCTVTAIHPTGMTTGYAITTDDSTF